MKHNSVHLFICKIHMDAWSFEYVGQTVRGVQKCEVCGKLTNFVVYYDSTKDIPMTIVKYLE